jgi:hypothetical protein
MKLFFATIILCSIATGTVANTGISSTHPLYGKWAWTYQKNNCTEVYDYRTDNISIVTSGDEIGESHFTISDKPDLDGFYRMTDTQTKSNGRTGCDGAPGGTPVGDTITVHIFFLPAKDEMLICQDPSLNACFGPLRRLSK